MGFVCHYFHELHKDKKGKLGDQAHVGKTALYHCLLEVHSAPGGGKGSDKSYSDGTYISLVLKFPCFPHFNIFEIMIY